MEREIEIERDDRERRRDRERKEDNYAFTCVYKHDCSFTSPRCLP